MRGPEALKSSHWVIRVVVEHASTDDGGSSDGVFPVDGLEVSGCTCDVFWPIGEVNEPKHVSTYRRKEKLSWRHQKLWVAPSSGLPARAHRSLHSECVARFLPSSSQASSGSSSK